MKITQCNTLVTSSFKSFSHNQLIMTKTHYETPGILDRMSNYAVNHPKIFNALKFGTVAASTVICGYIGHNTLGVDVIHHEATLAKDYIDPFVGPRHFDAKPAWDEITPTGWVLGLSSGLFGSLIGLNNAKKLLKRKV
jgi:hypothetical protein